jgi:hypothetical protein
MNIQDRVNRIESTSHLIFLDNNTIHTIDNIEIHEDSIFIKTSSGLLFLDIDVFTLQEAHHMELKIQELLEECL